MTLGLKPSKQPAAGRLVPRASYGLESLAVMSRGVGVTLLLHLAVACTAPSATSTSLSGAAEKGPFILGATITVSPTDSEGNPSGTTYVTQTVSDQGNFKLELSYDGLVSLQGDGFYYNEVTGTLSNAPGTLRAFHQVGAAEEGAFINTVTHLTHDRIGVLLAGGAAFAAAQQQAEQELRVALQLSGAPVDVAGDQMTMLGGDTDPSAYLFATSAVIVQAGVTSAGANAVDGPIQQLVNTIASNLAVDGTLPANVIAQLVDAQRALDTEGVKAMFATRLAAIGSTAVVPDLDRFIDTDGDGVVNAVDNCRSQFNPDQVNTHGFDRGDVCSPSMIVVSAGDQQTGGRSAVLEPFEVTVTDPQGQPVAGWTVTFSITAGNGSLAPATALTDAAGKASTVLTLGTVLENNTVTATTGYPTVSPAVFSADTVVTFWPTVQALANGGYFQPITADFNGDGVPDLAVSIPFGNAVAVMTNETPSGAITPDFAPATLLTFTAYGMAVGDFNEDGRLDLVVASCSGVQGASITATTFINTTPASSTTTTFAPAVTVPGTTCVSGRPSIAVGDLNRDGKPDVVLYQSQFGVSPQTPSAISAFVNTTATGSGSPSFASAITLATTSGAGVAVVDIDRSGSPDVVFADNGPSGEIWLLSNQTAPGSGTLSFAAPVTVPLATALSVVSTIVVSDVNSDGVPDLVVPDVDCRSQNCNIAVLANATAVGGALSLVETTVVAQAMGNSYSALASLSLVDLDGDAALDLVFADGHLQTIYNTTPAGAATPSFQVQRQVVTSLNNYSLGPMLLADLNGDSLVDVVGGYNSDLGISIQR